jgi:hypothetical protein
VFEKMHGHRVSGTQNSVWKPRSILARVAGGASERTIEGASTCSSDAGFGAVREKIFPS